MAIISIGNNAVLARYLLRSDNGAALLQRILKWKDGIVIICTGMFYTSLLVSQIKKPGAKGKIIT